MNPIRCTVPRGQSEVVTIETRNAKYNYICIYDPSGDFEGGHFSYYEIKLNRTNFEIGTIFEDERTGKKVKIVPSTRKRKDLTINVVQNIGEK